MLNAKLSQDKKTLIIEITFDESGAPSMTGKTNVHASTHGNQPTTIQMKNGPLVIGVNAYSKR